MCIFLVGLSVSGPTRVGDTRPSGKPMLFDSFSKHLDLAHTTNAVERIVAANRCYTR